MKKLHFWLLATLFTASFAVVGCGDDEVTPSNSGSENNTETKDTTTTDTTTTDTITTDTTTIDTTTIDTVANARLVSITYNGTSATVDIPTDLAGEITAEVNGAHVVITNTNETDETEFQLTGSSTDGSFTYNGTYKSTLSLNGLSLQSQQGAALNILCGKRIAVILEDSTTNTLSDYAAGDQKACFYCKGHVEFEGGGTLNVTGNLTHAIKTKEYMQLKKSTGVINILGAAGDAIHVGQYYLQSGGTVNITSTTQADGIQVEVTTLDDDITPDPDDENNGQVIINGGNINIEVAHEDCEGIKCDSLITIQGGTFNITASGNGSRGIQTDGNMVVGEESGKTSITIAAKGGLCTAAADADDPHRCMGIKVDGNLTVNAGTITVTNTGTKSRGIRVGTYTKNGGTVNATIKKDA